MTKVALSFCCRPGWAMRAIGSTLPPGGNGTMILMMPDGQLSAFATSASAAVSGEASAPATSVRRVNCMMSSLGIFALGFFEYFSDLTLFFRRRDRRGLSRAFECIGDKAIGFHLLD